MSEHTRSTGCCCKKSNCEAQPKLFMNPNIQLIRSIAEETLLSLADDVVLVVADAIQPYVNQRGITSGSCHRVVTAKTLLGFPPRRGACWDAKPNSLRHHSDTWVSVLIVRESVREIPSSTLGASVFPVVRFAHDANRRRCCWQKC
jgi:hypothetical protein